MCVEHDGARPSPVDRAVHVQPVLGERARRRVRDIPRHLDPVPFRTRQRVELPEPGGPAEEAVHDQRARPPAERVGRSSGCCARHASEGIKKRARRRHLTRYRPPRATCCLRAAANASIPGRGRVAIVSIPRTWDTTARRRPVPGVSQVTPRVDSASEWTSESKSVTLRRFAGSRAGSDERGRDAEHLDSQRLRARARRV